MPLFFMRWLARLPWLPVLLLGGLGYTIAHSLTLAHWTSDASHWVIIPLGLLCGALLAASRWRGPLALAYTLVTAWVAANETLAQLSAALQLPSAEIWLNAHTRLIAWGVRFNSWSAALSNGQPVHDTGLFVFLLAWVIWNASAWLAWCAFRRQALEGVLPVGGLLAVNVHLSRQPVGGFALFIGLSMLLIAHSSFRESHADWKKRRVDYPNELGWDWAGWAMVCAVVIAAAAWAAPWVGTPEGWRTLSEMARGPREQIQAFTENLFPDVHPPPESRPSARLPDVSRIGAPPDQSNTTIMWVRTSDPAPAPMQAAGAGYTPPQHYWRGETYVTYTGLGWEPATLTEEMMPLGAGRYALTQTFSLEVAHSEQLFAVNQPFAVSSNVTLTRAGLVRGQANAYEVTSWAALPTETQLQNAGADYPAALAEAYLQLPPTLPARVRQLAAQLTAGLGTPYAKASRLQNYLRANYAYALDTPPPPAGHDAVDYFLFEARAGFCSYYASALAVMLRAEGIPARVVTGYATGTYDYDQQAYHVMGGAAHAWVEVYFPGLGWVEFEPTSSRAAFQYLAITAPTPSATLATSLLPSKPALWPIGVCASAAILLIALWWRVMIRAPRTPIEQSRTLYWAMRRALARAGYRAPASTTPDEFMQATMNHLFAIAPITRLYTRALYSPRAPSPAEVQTAQALWRAARLQRLRLWFRAVVPAIKVLLKSRPPRSA